MEYNSAYEDLANAIVIQAVLDYRKALRVLKKYPGDDDASREKRSCERFFNSDWYCALTNVDPEMLMSRIQREERWI